jgi:predicted dehydrogenase
VLEGDGLVQWLRDRDVALASAEQEFLVAARRAIAGEQVPRLRPDVRDALRAHQLVDAMYRSARDGGTVVGVPDRSA